MKYITNNFWFFLIGLFLGLLGMYAMLHLRYVGIGTTLAAIFILSYSVYKEFDKESSLRIVVGVTLRVIFITAFIVAILTNLGWLIHVLRPLSL